MYVLLVEQMRRMSGNEPMWAICLLWLMVAVLVVIGIGILRSFGKGAK